MEGRCERVEGPLPPMKLSVNARRIKHRKRKVEIIKIHKSLAVADCECRISSRDSNILLLDVEIVGVNGSYHQTFHILKKTIIKLIGKFTDASYPYPYRIKWRMGKVHYKLKVNKLSLTSSLIKLNHQFKICHIAH